MEQGYEDLIRDLASQSFSATSDMTLRELERLRSVEQTAPAPYIAAADPQMISEKFQELTKAIKIPESVSVSEGRGAFRTLIARLKQSIKSDLDQTHLFVRIFYATDRRSITASVNAIKFGPDRSVLGKLTYGSCEFSIPKKHKMDT